MISSKKVVPLVFFILISLLSFGQEKLSYFLPNDVEYDQNIPSPEDFFNQQLGEWHLTHDQVIYYMKEIAERSERSIFYEYARSYENRPLVHLVITSEKNQKKLDELKELHYKFSEPGSTIPKSDVPLVISLTYGVHGNESSTTNSSVLTAYYLAAAKGENIDRLLENTIVIIDPCMNPDGFTRHSTWANMHQSYLSNGDSNSRQFSEVWPGGRTNHYWFDMNRDYLLLVSPESRGKVAKFHEWKPNIVTDHHEMSANSSFFFQPGVPSRNNPLTPASNYKLTHEIAQYHAAYLDKIGSSYFSEEQFDDYYVGKGSSYPDVNGSIGILFEQAGYRGRIRNTTNGIKKLSYGIKNQFTVSLSTLDAGLNLRDELLDMQKEFYESALKEAEKRETKAYVFGSDKDKVKTQLFVDLLNQHQIKVFSNKKDLNINNTQFKANHSYIVPVKQKQYRLLTSIFEEVNSFTDTTFYDVSTWTFTHTLGVNCAKLKSLKGIIMDQTTAISNKISGKVIGGKSELGYLFRWHEYSTPSALYQLQDAGLRTKVSTQQFSFDIDGEMENFSYGTIFVPVSDQSLSSDEIFKLAQSTSQATGIDFYGLSTGLSPQGIDSGSGSFRSLEKAKVLLFVGGNTSSRDAGEIWHLFDQRYNVPITLTETSKLKSIDLTQYNTIVLTGFLREWNLSEVNKLKNWISQGGNIIVYKEAAVWASQNELGNTEYVKSVEPDTSKYLKYIERRKERSLNYISGAIFETNIDITHPLCYGYTSEKLSVFKTSTTVAKPLGQKYLEPVSFTSNPHLSGWVSDSNIERIKNAPVVSVQAIGKGTLISYHDNMNFRGIWLGTSKLFSNSIFFGNILP